MTKEEFAGLKAGEVILFNRPEKKRHGRLFHIIAKKGKGWLVSDGSATVALTPHYWEKIEAPCPRCKYPGNKLDDLVHKCRKCNLLFKVANVGTAEN